jgi:serine O-acetyltransferase
LIINNATKVGANCRIHNNVVIGTEAGRSDQCPTIGDNVFIAPGAVIFGNIRIADDIAIGANSVVNRDFLDKGITIAGVPAKKISDKGSQGTLKRATEIIGQRDNRELNHETAGTSDSATR